jgi:hypothetical protein
VRFLVIAIDHTWQLVPNGIESPEVAAAKGQLLAAVGQAIADWAIGLICEESDPCQLSIAQKIAYEHNPRIPWKNINMSAQQRMETGIWEALLHRPSHEIEEPPDSGNYRSIDHRIPEDEVRERFFARDSVESASTVGARNVLVLCGDMHVEFLRQILEAENHEAETSHALIPRQYWQ